MPNSNTTVANSASRLRLQTTNTAAVSMEKTYALTSGKHYRVSFDADAATYTNVNVDILGYGGNALSSATLNTGVTHYELDFVANDVSTVIKVSLGTGTGTRTIYLDNVKLEEIKGDVEGFAYNFNGKELDGEGLGGGGSTYDYGFRIYNANLGRFLSVDPLTKKFPELSTYQFASNTPLQAIDLDGKEAFFIHVTASSPASCTPRLTNFITRTLTNNIHQDATFNWKKDVGGENLNRLSNNEGDRRAAAMMLVGHIILYRAQNKITDEKITLIGHSHGGNIAIQAASILNKLYNIKVNIITVNTPAYNNKGDVENPAGNQGINDMISFSTKGDAVAGQIAPGSDDKYKSTPDSPVRNYELTPLEGGPFDAHYLDNVSLVSIQETKAEKLKPVEDKSKNPKKN